VSFISCIVGAQTVGPAIHWQASTLLGLLLLRKRVMN
jgi:hypothetical protein